MALVIVAPFSCAQILQDKANTLIGLALVRSLANAQSSTDTSTVPSERQRELQIRVQIF